MEIVHNKVVSGEVVPIDDKHFLKCRFTKCTLLFSGGDFAATQTVFDQCQVQLSGAAQKTAALLTTIGMLPPPNNGNPPMNPTGKPQ